MTPTLDAHLSADHSSATTLEWRGAREARLNVLLEGPAHATQASLRLLLRDLGGPVATNRAGSRLELPSDCGALILENIAALDADEQTRLHEWLESSGRYPQVVSTAVDSLFPRVAGGLFDEALYYRLNTVYWNVGDRGGDSASG